MSVGIKGASVIGHTDSTGAEEYNAGLSQRRAQAVAQSMIVAGMDSSRIRVEGRGESQPIDSNDTEEGRAQNRRVVIVVSPEDAQ